MEGHAGGSIAACQDRENVSLGEPTLRRMEPAGKSLMNNEQEQHKRPNRCRTTARKPGIVVADDMALILTLLKFEMESRAFNAWLAVDGDDALDLYRRHRDELDLVKLDVQMRGLEGPHTLEALQRLNPEVAACFMSGECSAYTEEELLAQDEQTLNPSNLKVVRAECAKKE